MGVSKIISRGAEGTDSLAKKYAEDMELLLKIYNPNYRKYGKRSPIIRNFTNCKKCR